MNILIIGSGGREHALAWKIKQSNKTDNLYVLPGNGGTAEIAINLQGNDTDFELIRKYVLSYKIDLIVVGPEVPLAEGIVDYFADVPVKIFGPNKYASQFEASKAFTKKFLVENNIATAKYWEFTSLKEAMFFLDSCSFPIVIKADGLAAGKGVIIAHDKKTANEALVDILDKKVFGSAGHSVVIEEFLSGEEVSILAFVDKNTIVPMVPVQDHKAIFDGDKGPNTGGMGTYSSAPIVDSKLKEKIEKLLKDIHKGFTKNNILYRGILFVGLMIVDGEPIVLEFNVRFGDPETQVILPRLRTDLVDLMLSINDDKLSEQLIEWQSGFAVCVVMASGGYPDKYEKGKIITGLDKVDTLIFHAGTKKEKDKTLTSGGRVLGVTGLDITLSGAIEKAYTNVSKIHFEGSYYRQDIATKAMKYIKD